MKLNKRTLDKIANEAMKMVKDDIKSGKVDKAHDSMWMDLVNISNRLAIIAQVKEHENNG